METGKPLIHPTALIDEAATLAPGVRVGAYACIEGSVQIAAGCVVEAHAILTGDVHIGAESRIGHGAVIGAEPQDRAFDPATESGVRIGARCIVREHCTIHRGTAPGSVTTVGDDCFLMAGAHLGHNAHLGNHVVLANNVLLAGHVHIGDRTFAGGGSVFHQFVRVGRLAMTQGNSAFSQDVPPFALAAGLNTVHGLNVVGLRRAGIAAGERAEIKAAFKLVYAAGLNRTQALAAARERTWGACAREFLDFAATATRRGLSAPRGRAIAVTEG